MKKYGEKESNITFLWKAPGTVSRVHLVKGRGGDGVFGTSNLLVTYSSTVGLFFSPEVSLDLREVGERKIKRPSWGGCEGGERRKKP